MATSRLTALRLARPTEWHTLVRNALERTRSVPAAADYLTEHRWPCSRGLLYRYLHDYPTLAEGIPLPAPRGLPRGEPRQDKRPDWQPSDETLKRREHRAATRKDPT